MADIATSDRTGKLGKLVAGRQLVQVDDLLALILTLYKKANTESKASTSIRQAG